MDMVTRYNTTVKRALLILRSLKPRSPFYPLALLSLLLCFAILTLWVDSCFCARRIARYYDDDIMLASDSGKLAMQTVRGVPRNRGALWRYESGPARIWGGAHLNSELYGYFGFGHVVVKNRYTITQTWIPYWSVAAFTGIIPTIWALRRFRQYLATRRARLVGLCPRCHYDLRASPDRCPECGLQIRVPAIQT